jgi:hypothetical protein
MLPFQEYEQMGDGVKDKTCPLAVDRLLSPRMSNVTQILSATRLSLFPLTFMAVKLRILGGFCLLCGPG